MSAQIPPVPANGSASTPAANGHSPANPAALNLADPNALLATFSQGLMALQMLAIHAQSGGRPDGTKPAMGMPMPNLFANLPWPSPATAPTSAAMAPISPGMSAIPMNLSDTYDKKLAEVEARVVAAASQEGGNSGDISAIAPQQSPQKAIPQTQTSPSTPISKEVHILQPKRKGTPSSAQIGIPSAAAHTTPLHTSPLPSPPLPSSPLPAFPLLPFPPFPFPLFPSHLPAPPLPSPPHSSPYHKNAVSHMPARQTASAKRARQQLSGGSAKRRVSNSEYRRSARRRSVSSSSHSSGSSSVSSHSDRNRSVRRRLNTSPSASAASSESSSSSGGRHNNSPSSYGDVSMRNIAHSHAQQDFRRSHTRSILKTAGSRLSPSMHGRRSQSRVRIMAHETSDSGTESSGSDRRPARITDDAGGPSRPSHRSYRSASILVDKEITARPKSTIYDDRAHSSHRSKSTAPVRKHAVEQHAPDPVPRRFVERSSSLPPTRPVAGFSSLLSLKGIGALSVPAPTASLVGKDVSILQLSPAREDNRATTQGPSGMPLRDSKLVNKPLRKDKGPSLELKRLTVDSPIRKVALPPSVSLEKDIISCSLAALISSNASGPGTQSPAKSTRSGRVSVPPLAHWRNERLRYTEDDTKVTMQVSSPAAEPGSDLKGFAIAELAARSTLPRPFKKKSTEDVGTEGKVVSDIRSAAKVGMKKKSTAAGAEAPAPKVSNGKKASNPAAEEASSDVHPEGRKAKPRKDVKVSVAAGTSLEAGSAQRKPKARRNKKASITAGAAAEVGPAEPKAQARKDKKASHKAGATAGAGPAKKLAKTRKNKMASSIAGATAEMASGEWREKTLQRMAPSEKPATSVRKPKSSMIAHSSPPRPPKASLLDGSDAISPIGPQHPPSVPYSEGRRRASSSHTNQLPDMSLRRTSRTSMPPDRFVAGTAVPSGAQTEVEHKMPRKEVKLMASSTSTVNDGKVAVDTATGVAAGDRSMHSLAATASGSEGGFAVRRTSRASVPPDRFANLGLRDNDALGDVSAVTGSNMLDGHSETLRKRKRDPAVSASTREVTSIRPLKAKRAPKPSVKAHVPTEGAPVEGSPAKRPRISKDRRKLLREHLEALAREGIPTEEQVTTQNSDEVDAFGITIDGELEDIFRTASRAAAPRAIHSDSPDTPVFFQKADRNALDGYVAQLGKGGVMHLQRRGTPARAKKRPKKRSQLPEHTTPDASSEEEEISGASEVDEDDELVQKLGLR